MDSELVQRCKAGDVGAYEDLYKLHGQKLFALCYRMTGSREDAEDILQEIFVILVKKIGSYRGDAKFSTWLHRIAVNASLDFMRKNKRNTEVINDEMPQFYDALSARRMEQGQSIKKALMALPPGYRAVVVLHDIQGFKHKEIAQMRGTSEGAVKSQLFKARRKMRTMLYNSSD